MRRWPTWCALWIGCASHGSVAKPATESASDGQPGSEAGADAGAATTCGSASCEPPQQCIKYVGVAGPSVPLQVCGIPCGPDSGCPSGLTCRRDADGPRQCRP